MDVVNPTDEKTKCKQRFKGVENFLRRVAFNLGNTPSQTEVKIISCIPIDVTDLQQKIIQLEKQLEDAKTTKVVTKESGKDTTKKASKDAGKNANKDADKNAAKDSNKDANKNDGTENKNNPKPEGSKDCPGRSSAVHTALFTSHFPRFTSANACKAIECTQSNQGIQCDNSVVNKRKKSTVSFLFSNTPSNKAVNCSDKSNLTSEERSHTVLNELRKKFLKKKKKGSRNQKVEAQLVYYARTDNVLYNRNALYKNVTPEMPHNTRQLIDRPFLTNMVQKQYTSVPVIDELSDNSQFSSPICRDVDTACQNSYPYESDICSCCHETFHNVDNYITSGQVDELPSLSLNTNPNRNAYYDSSLYDLVPVKEKPVRSRKDWRDIDISKRKENKIDMKCWPENVRPKTRSSSVIVNYHTVVPARHDRTRRNPHKTYKRDSVSRIVNRKDKHVLKVDQQTAIKSSNSCCIDLGDLYPKVVQKNKTLIMTDSMRPPLRNAECFTEDFSRVDCETTTLKTNDKTEMTLNQIKSILQSVLTEVKTNTLSKNIDNNKAKKDAIIQKGASQSNIQDGSSFLNSFTYSPYNLNPYGPSCSKQMPSNYFYHPGIPQSMRCMQNYPLFIQTPGRHMCTSCYRSSQYKSNPKNTTIATNTDEQEKRGKETEKLIQEIYKSVAVSLPGKDTSLSEYDDLKSTKTASNKSKEIDVKETKKIISEIFRNTDMQVNTSDTHNTNTTVFYKNHKDMSTRSHSITTEPSVDHRNKTKKEENNQQSTETETEIEKRKYPRRVVKPTKRIETISESTDTETSSTETDSDITTVTIKKPEKKKSGLISKVFNLFNRNKKKKDAKVELTVESDSSDSDYQTIYSQKISPPKRTEHRNPRSRAHSKLHSRRAHQASRSPDRPKRTPYMEQEYRRLWNEKLMFHNTRPRYSSEQPPTRETIPRTRQRPVYYQNYEARSVLVDPRSYRPRYDVINGKPCLAEVNGQGRPYAQTNYPNVCRIGEGARAVNSTRRNVAIQDAAPMKRVVNPNKTVTKGLPWVKNHKIKRCGEQWKKFIIES